MHAKIQPRFGTCRQNFQRTKKMKLTVAVDGMELAGKAIKEKN